MPPFSVFKFAKEQQNSKEVSAKSYVDYNLNITWYGQNNTNYLAFTNIFYTDILTR